MRCSPKKFHEDADLWDQLPAVGVGSANGAIHHPISPPSSTWHEGPPHVSPLVFSGFHPQSQPADRFPCLRFSLDVLRNSRDSATYWMPVLPHAAVRGTRPTGSEDRYLFCLELARTKREGDCLGCVCVWEKPDTTEGN